MDEKVIELDLVYEPEAGDSGAFLIQDEYQTYLMFNAIKKAEDGFYEQNVGIAIVEVIRCSITKFGYPNDEALCGHPLYSKGLNSYGIFEVKNSNWIAEQEKQNKVNFPDRTDFSWKRHFAFVFHDSIFECLAKDLKLEISNDPIDRILRKLAEKFIKEF